MVTDTQFFNSAITEAHLNMMISNEPASFFSMVTKMEDAIIRGYDGTPLQEYINRWNRVMVEHFRSKNIDLSKTRKAEWITVASGIIDMSAKCRYGFQRCELSGSVSKSCVSGLSAPDSGLSAISFASDFSARRSSTAQSNAAESICDTDSPSAKIPKLSVLDKKIIQSLYDRLDRSKMWRLSNGTIVEDKMKEVALGFEYEHPCHSLILDVNDACWSEVFESDEIEEIRSFRSVEMPVMSAEVESYIQALNTLNPSQLYAKVDSGVHDIASDSSWLQKSYRDAFRLLQSDFFPMESQTEGNVVKRVWSCLDSCFDFSTIKSVR
ncbi:succinate--CoA ligase beta chain [Mucor velutinosus]|uniref:Succinate--CoA ligase beta chain n=1 Tax=Mucor velutinosus TaxID=708070 RepID=A0AAN7DMF1_9FUNG|nr:succinate--CoA ligase beta chain [Mucor velutinosus]